MYVENEGLNVSFAAGTCLQETINMSRINIEWGDRFFIKNCLRSGSKFSAKIKDKSHKIIGK